LAVADDTSKVFDPYEIAGIIVPGGTLLLGLTLLFPTIAKYADSKGVSLGDLGIFVFASYCVGHILQEPANRISDAVWKRTGRPVERARKPGGGLATVQVAEIPIQLKNILNVNVSLEDDDEGYAGIIRQVLAQLANAGVSTRLDIFNRYSALFRGLALALSAIAAVAAIQHLWISSGVAALLAWFAWLRMQRFSQYYALEVWVQFLSLPRRETERKP
jgi:hypothetical protein